MLKRILGLAAVLTLALTGGAQAMDDRVGKEMNQDHLSLDQQHGRDLTDQPSGDMGNHRAWGGDDGSAASQNHQPDWTRPAPRPVRTVDVPAPDTETSSEALRPEFEAYGGGKGHDHGDKIKAKKTSSAATSEATPHLALLDAYLDGAAANAKVLASLGDRSKSSYRREARKNLELSLSKAIEHANHLSEIDVDATHLLAHLRQAKRSLSSSSGELSSHLSAAEASFQSLAEGSSYAASDAGFCDRQPVSGQDDELDLDATEPRKPPRHPAPMDIDADSMPGHNSIPGAEDKQNLPPPAQPGAPVSEDSSK